MQFAPQSAYYHAKQSCYLCLQTSELVDTGVQIEGEGVLAICRGCVTGDMLNALGISLDALEVDSEVVAALQDELAEAKAATKAARAQLRDLRRSTRLSAAEPALV